MAAVPIYVWNGTAWQETGPTIPANPIKYQASAPTSPSTGDIWVDSDGDVTTGSQQFQRFRFVASGGETTISGADANGAVLAYTAGLEQVVLNGAVLVRGFDYTATNGTTITGLSPALVASDVLEVFSFIAFTVANTYTQSQVDGLLDSYVGLRLITPTSAVNGTVGTTGAVTFSAASSVSLNGCFSTTYDNYKIIIDFTATNANDFNLKLRAVTDNSDAQYQRQELKAGSTTVVASRATSQTSFRTAAVGSVDRTSLIIELFNPFLARFTGIQTSMGNGYNSGGPEVIYCTGGHNVATSFDGLSLIPSTGTITGTIRVYGYKN